jgi:hypothetical protein
MLHGGVCALQRKREAGACEDRRDQTFSDMACFHDIPLLELISRAVSAMGKVAAIWASATGASAGGGDIPCATPIA